MGNDFAFALGLRYVGYCNTQPKLSVSFIFLQDSLSMRSVVTLFRGHLFFFPAVLFVPVTGPGWQKDISVAPAQRPQTNPAQA